MESIVQDGEGSEQQNFLKGWKEIAAFLGMGVRTVQRYERHLGLPVRRPSGRHRGAVVARRAELKSWLEDCPKGHQRAKDNIALDNLKASMQENNRLRLETQLLRDELMIVIQNLQESLGTSRKANRRVG